MTETPINTRREGGIFEVTLDRLEELEINPLMVTPHAAVAADALIRLRED